MARAVHSGCSNAAVPTLTRRQPVDSAKAKESASRIPGQLDLQIQSTDDVGDDLPVVATSEGGIEVDEVDPLGALVLPAFGGQPRVAELPARSGDALLKLHGTSLGDVDGGEELQAGRGGHWGFASGVGG